MTINLIPTQKMPRSLSELTYQIPADLEKKIKIGSLVTAPLRDSFTDGIVTAIHKKNIKKPYPLKYIHDLKTDKIVFTSNQLTLFSDLAKYYYVSTSLFVHFNLPKFIKSDWDKLPSKIKSTPNKKNKPQTKYLWWNDINERNKFYKRQISSTLKNSKQILFIVPRLADIPILAEHLNLKESDYTPIHRKLSRPENAKLWLSLINHTSRTPQTIIGTRSSLFYPYQNLCSIIIDDEPSLDHKQYDMNPRYDVSVVANYLKQILNIKIIYSSPAPSLETYHKLRPKPPATLNTKIIHLNLKDEIEKKNYTLLSEKLIEHVKSTLDKKQNVFLFSNRKGESKSVTCRDCGHIFSCPTCELPLTKTAEDKLVCYHCNYSEILPPFCPTCQGPDFSSTGLGIQKVFNYLKKEFTDTPITRLDKDSSMPGEECRMPNIIVGTEFALNKINWKRIALLAFINVDQLWHHSEFMSSENGYCLLHKILTLPPKNATIIIQSFSWKSKIIQSIIRNNPDVFYHPEIEFRETFGYPPFKNLIKISSLDKKEKIARNKAEHVYKKLKTAFPDLEITNPSPILHKKIRAYYKFNLILKLNKLSELDKIIKLIPNDFLVDIHPRTLLD